MAMDRWVGISKVKKSDRIVGGLVTVKSSVCGMRWVSAVYVKAKVEMRTVSLRWRTNRKHMSPRRSRKQKVEVLANAKLYMVQLKDSKLSEIKVSVID